jgi:hypothetical protein
MVVVDGMYDNFVRKRIRGVDVEQKDEYSDDG